MTDINSKQQPVNTPNGKTQNGKANGLSRDEDRILSLMELFYFAYRDFTTDGDEVLAKIGYGRAHHRTLHFVNHYPGLRVADLLNILKITKQSLARVLKQLIDEGYIRRHQGDKDRRERRLFITPKGQELAHRLATPQINRFQQALVSLSKDERQTVEKFLFHLIETPHRHEVITLLAENGHKISELCNNLNQEDH